MLRQSPRDVVQRGLRIVGGGQVSATGAVDLHVDQAGCDPAILVNCEIARLGPGRRLYENNSTLGYLDPRGWQLVTVAEHAPPQH